MPTGVYKRKTKQSDEEIKAKQKEYRDRPENKAKRTALLKIKYKILNTNF